MNLAGNEPTTMMTRDPRWVPLLNRDPAFDGSFFYSVKSTGVYCYPSCGARRPRPENVQFHATAAEAEQAGFRPCKRCKPGQPSLQQQHVSSVEKACRAIERSEQELSLEDLAARAGMSPFHFHRVFKAVTGLTPKKFAAARRSNRMRRELRNGTSVTEAMYAAGYNSSSRFYADSSETLGMKPSVFQAGGTDTDIRYAIGKCSLGSVLVAQSVRGVCSILLGDEGDQLVRDLERRFPRANFLRDGERFEKLVDDVIRLVESPQIGLELPLDIRGTLFQQKVWHALREIPAGTTETYGQIAQRIGSPAAVRAVAGACAANSLAVAIPCHRVIRSDGGLSGYRWGVDRKRKLLERERGIEN